MAFTTNTQSIEGSVPNFSSGQLVLDGSGPGAGLLLSLGFIPRYFKLWNTTDAAKHEWHEGMPAASAEKTVTAGTLTYITANGITVGASGAAGNGTTAPAEGQVFLDPALTPASKTLYWAAFG